MYNFESDGFQFINYVDLTESQHRLVHAARNHPDIRKWMTNNEEFSFESHMSFIEKLKTDETHIFWAVFKEQKYVGSVYISDYNSQDKTGEGGDYVAPLCLGSGIGVEIRYIFYRYVMTELKLKKLFGRILLANKNSIVTLKKLGIKEYGRDTQYISCVLTPEEWVYVPETLEEFKKSLYKKRK